MTMHEPTQQDAEKILAIHFHDSKINNISRITTGYSHYMFDCTLDDKNVIVRISTNTHAEFNIQKELWVMKHFADKNIPIPNVYASDISRKVFPFDYMVMQKLEGKQLDTIWETLSPDDKKEIAVLLGKFIAKIHTITFDRFGRIGQDGIVHRKEFSFRKQGTKIEKNQWTKTVLQDAFKELVGLISLNMITPEQSSAITAYLHQHKDLTNHCESVMIHNDVVFSHIFVTKDDSWKITGIIDFEFANAYAREFEFIKFHREGLLDDNAFKDALFEGYGRENLHPNFDEAVGFYRLVRDIGFAHYVATAGNIDASTKAISGILDKVRKE